MKGNFCGAFFVFFVVLNYSSYIFLGEFVPSKFPYDGFFHARIALPYIVCIFDNNFQDNSI